MCGIAGVLHTDGGQPDPRVLERMNASIAHRGPDGVGSLCQGPIGLTHRRLAIIDLSDAAAQPLANEDGSVQLIYNGEVYNFAQLRTELEAAGHTFRSRTDSEVIVHGYEAWGEAVLERLDGMFAFALWDARRQTLTLARDRYGIKPLYWYAGGGVLVFASEIKALLEHPAVGRDICYPALNEYFSFQNVLSDRTLFDGIRLLPPGHLLSAAPGEPHRLRQYWDYPFHLEPLTLTEEEAAEEVSRLFTKAVTDQLVSDVPVGAYLSGGMDSGSIASVAGRHLARLRTFTAGFDMSSATGLELAFDERAEAEYLANLLKTEHYEVVLHAGDMEHVLPELIWHLEDLRVGQCYPNYYVARLASRFVKVVLSGAGGDELFGGYPWRYYRGVGSTDREDYLRRYYGFWQRLVPDEEKPQLFSEATQRRIGDLSAFDQFRAVFDGFRRPIEDPESYVAASLYFELKTFLPGLLVVEDKLSMAHSLETRVPFLADELVDLAVRLPTSLKLRNLGSSPVVDEDDTAGRRRYQEQNSDGKAVLRIAMARMLPERIAARPKQGFSAPDASWFRGESIDYLTRLFSDRRARIYEFLNPEYVDAILAEHTSGRVNHRLLIWSLLSLEWWVRAFLEGGAGAGRSAPEPSTAVRDVGAGVA